MSMTFVNLHHHSTFSFGDGFGTPQQHVARAVELGYTAIAFTEHGNVSSHFQAEKAAVKAGIKPIFGLEAYCGAVGDDKQQFKNHLTVLAEDLNGYQNLNKIVTQSYLDYYYHPTVSGDSLLSHREGLTILSGCSGSLLACTLLGGKGIPEPDGGPDYNAAIDVIERFGSIFPDRYYLEIQPFPELERSCEMNPAYERLSEDTGIPLVVTHDVHYPTMGDSEMQAVLHAVHRGKASVDDAMRDWNYDVKMCLPDSDDDLLERIIQTGVSRKAARGAIEATAIIASRCNVTLPKADRLQYPVSESDLVPWEMPNARLGRG